MGIITMSGSIKKILAVLMALLLVFAFAACGKDDVDSSNPSSTIDPTQDYNDEWGEMSGLTSSDLEDVESLWNDNKGDAEIVNPDNSDSNTNSSDNDTSSNPASSDTTSSNEEGTANDGELSGEITGDIGAIF